MASSLDSLSSNLVKDGRKLTGFEDYSGEQYELLIRNGVYRYELLIRNGVYPYEYMPNWDTSYS